MKDAAFTILCDVKNPLYGKDGAAFVYAPQKGAGPEEVAALDRGLRSFSAVADRLTGKNEALSEGSGAAGGIGYAAKTFLDAASRSGIECVLDLIGADELISSADLIVTGEGRMDAQSLMGKVVSGVCARRAGKPVAAVVGTFEGDMEQAKQLGIFAVVETNPAHRPFEEIKDSAREDLIAAIRREAAVFLS